MVCRPARHPSRVWLRRKTRPLNPTAHGRGSCFMRPLPRHQAESAPGRRRGSDRALVRVRAVAAAVEVGAPPTARGMASAAVAVVAPVATSGVTVTRTAATSAGSKPTPNAGVVEFHTVTGAPTAVRQTQWRHLYSPRGGLGRLQRAAVGYLVQATRWTLCGATTACSRPRRLWVATSR